MSLAASNAAAVGRAGAIQVVVAALHAHGAHAGVQQYACWALWNICRMRCGLCSRARGAGAVSALDAVLARFPTGDVADWAKREMLRFEVMHGAARCRRTRRRRSVSSAAGARCAPDVSPRAACRSPVRRACGGTRWRGCPPSAPCVARSVIAPSLGHTSVRSAVRDPEHIDSQPLSAR
jgi:hypothetical protein